MGNAILKNKRGQSNLETAVAFIMMVLLLGGVTKVWLWANTAIVKRQVEYNKTRVESGQAELEYALHWPLDYTPVSLNAEDVILDDR